MKFKGVGKAIIFLVSLVLFLVVTNTAKAAPDECKKQPCFVPAPTIVLPVNNGTTTGAVVTISGLTWKTTYVEMFVDGVKVENIKTKKHEDYYASFSAQVVLKPGKHVLYSFAYDEKNGWGGVSKESKHTVFYVTGSKSSNKIVANNAVKNPVKTDNVKKNEEVTKNIDKTEEKFYNEKPNDEQIVNVPAVEKSVNNDQVNKLIETKQNYLEVDDEKNEINVTSSTNQQLAGGTTETKDEVKIKRIDDYQKRLKTNRIIGFIILAGIALVSLFWLLLKEPTFSEEVNTSLLDKEKNNFESDDKGSE